MHAVGAAARSYHLARKNFPDLYAPLSVIAAACQLNAAKAAANVKVQLSRFKHGLATSHDSAAQAQLSRSAFVHAMTSDAVTIAADLHAAIARVHRADGLGGASVGAGLVARCQDDRDELDKQDELDEQDEQDEQDKRNDRDNVVKDKLVRFDKPDEYDKTGHKEGFEGFEAMHLCN
ncbi:uncharacterized protein JCM10292_001042 [Rhodotorula paludigena]|uniref:uncharacterized protein n=1 Tax=Rhodotorula paludigena TaxID=86838 RepID=UPI00316FABFA